MPTHLYLAVFVGKSAGSMDVHTYFSKYGQRVSRKDGNHDLKECDLVASEVDRSVLVELLFF